MTIKLIASEWWMCGRFACGVNVAVGTAIKQRKVRYGLVLELEGVEVVAGNSGSEMPCCV